MFYTGHGPPATTVKTMSVSALLGTPAPPSSTTRRRTAATTGNTPPLYCLDSGPADPVGHRPDEVQTRCVSHGCGGLHPPQRALLVPTRRSARRYYRPIAPTQSLYGNSSLTTHAFSQVTRRLHIQGRTPSATLLNYGSLIRLRVIHMPMKIESSTLRPGARP